MSQYLLLNRMTVQNANAIAGFTWGFPAITHFLGFSHSITRKLVNSNFNDITLSGCAVIAHQHHVHVYKSSYDFEFTQSRNPPYLNSHKKDATAPIIEEGKMNMTVSLIIKCEGNIGNREDDFISWIKNICYLQRLAGGTILDIDAVELFTMNDETLRIIKRKLLPGFVLLDRSNYLEKHYQTLQNKDKNAELFNAWLDFIALKQKARPQYDLIEKHLQKLPESEGNYYEIWQKHLTNPYDINSIPTELSNYFSRLKNNEKYLKQWQEYINPNENTNANWEYLKKPESGYLVPIMTGYKAISETYKNNEIEQTRDNETDVCFVESVHSIGEWKSIHRMQANNFSSVLWYYHYEKNWYLCKQLPTSENTTNEIVFENPDDDF